jgi:hypothetical protein
MSARVGHGTEPYQSLPVHANVGGFDERELINRPIPMKMMGLDSSLVLVEVGLENRGDEKEHSAPSVSADLPTPLFVPGPFVRVLFVRLTPCSSGLHRPSAS